MLRGSPALLLLNHLSCMQECNSNAEVLFMEWFFRRQVSLHLFTHLCIHPSFQAANYLSPSIFSPIYYSIYPFNKYLLSANYVPDTIVGILKEHRSIRYDPYPQKTKQREIDSDNEYTCSLFAITLWLLIQIPWFYGLWIIPVSTLESVLHDLDHHSPVDYRHIWWHIVEKKIYFSVIVVLVLK